MSLGWSSPAWLALAALAFPVLALFLLRPRRPRREVAALALWRASLHDPRAGHPAQRLRRHLSLWLALASLAAITLAAARPHRNLGHGSTADRLVLAIDTSASMGARLADGGTPLAAAVAAARARIAALRPGECLCLVAVGARARRLGGFSDDPRTLGDALAGLVPEAGATDLAAACRLLAAIAHEGPCRGSVLFTDGNLPATVDAEAPMPIELALLPTGGANLGITACAARRTAPGRWRVQVRIEASAATAMGGQLRIEQDGDLLAERPLAPVPVAEVAIEVAAADDRLLALRLQPYGPDCLTIDDEAWLALPKQRQLRVRVASGLDAWRRALAAQEDVIVADDDANADLVISDRSADLEDAAPLALGDGVVPVSLADLVEVGAGASAVADVRHGEPVLAHLALADLAIGERVAWAQAADEAAAERRGFRILVHGDSGPLLVAAQAAGGGERLFLLFASRRSTLPWRLAFPLLAGNLVDRTRALRGLDQTVCLPTGLLTLSGCAPGAEVRLRGPGGTVMSAQTDTDGVAAGLAADRPGPWILEDGFRHRHLGIGLLDPGETRLERRQSLQLRETTVPAAGAAASHAAGPLWPWLAAAAIALLAFDWWWMHRRW